MDADTQNNSKKCKKEPITYKRWADEEIKLLLKYLREQKEFEKPTAQIFYRKFLRLTGVDASWDLCRWKVKHLKTSYFKTESLIKSGNVTQHEIDESESVGPGKLRKVCRFYDELRIIFGPKKSAFQGLPSVVKDESEINSTSIAKEPANYPNEFIGFEGVDDFRLVTEPVVSLTEDDDCVEMQSESSSASLHSTSPSTESYVPSTFDHPSKAVRLKIAKPESSLGRLHFMQNERNTFLKLKLDFEKEKFKKEFALKERQFEEKIKERRENLELKKMDIEKEERLRRLEIEKQERVERLEIEMRYKYGSQK